MALKMATAKSGFSISQHFKFTICTDFIRNRDLIALNLKETINHQCVYALPALMIRLKIAIVSAFLPLPPSTQIIYQLIKTTFLSYRLKPPFYTVKRMQNA